MNRLTRIGIDGFRSLSDCEIRFPDNEQNALLCLVGKNGSGKSAVLHALDFAGQMFRGDISSWLAERNWQAGDLVPSARQGMLHFAIDGVVAGQAFGWSSALDPATLKCVREELRMDGRRVFELSDKGLAIKGRNVLSAAHERQGQMRNSRASMRSLPTKAPFCPRCPTSSCRHADFWKLSAS